MTIHYQISVIGLKQQKQQQNVIDLEDVVDLWLTSDWVDLWLTSDWVDLWLTTDLVDLVLPGEMSETVSWEVADPP